MTGKTFTDTEKKKKKKEKTKNKKTTKLKTDSDWVCGNSVISVNRLLNNQALEKKSQHYNTSCKPSQKVPGTQHTKMASDIVEAILSKPQVRTSLAKAVAVNRYTREKRNGIYVSKS